MNALEAQQCPDEELVRRLAEGQRQALDPLHERYGPVLTGLAARQLDRPAAEEIVQDVFLTVWQHASSFDPQRGRFRPWVFQITRRRIVNELRRRRSRPQVEADPEGVLLDGLEDDAPEVVDKVAADERRSAVRGALEVLPQPQREAVRCLSNGSSRRGAGVKASLHLKLTGAMLLVTFRAQLARCPSAPAASCNGGGRRTALGLPPAT